MGVGTTVATGCVGVMTTPAVGTGTFIATGAVTGAVTVMPSGIKGADRGGHWPGRSDSCR